MNHFSKLLTIGRVIVTALTLVTVSTFSLGAMQGQGDQGGQGNDNPFNAIQAVMRRGLAALRAQLAPADADRIDAMIQNIVRNIVRNMPAIQNDNNHGPIAPNGQVRDDR